MKKIATAAVAALLLAACATGPGKADIEKALAAFIEQVVFLEPTFRTIEVGDCVKDQGSAGYACAVDADVEFTEGHTGRTLKENFSGTFVFGEVGGQWKVIGQR